MSQPFMGMGLLLHVFMVKVLQQMVLVQFVQKDSTHVFNNKNYKL